MQSARPRHNNGLLEALRPRAVSLEILAATRPNRYPTVCLSSTQPSPAIVRPRSASTGGPAENFDAIFRISLERSWLPEKRFMEIVSREYLKKLSNARLQLFVERLVKVLEYRFGWRVGRT